MQTIERVGLVGLGKVGLPIAEKLLESGFEVVGYRRGSMAEFEKMGGTPAASPARVGAACDIVLSCVPTTEAMDEVIGGPDGLLSVARPGHIFIELGSHPAQNLERHVAPLTEAGAAFLDGAISGTPSMIAARKASVYLSGDAEAVARAEHVVQRIADSVFYFGRFGSASKIKLVANLLVAINIAATAEAMTLGLKSGVDVDTMVRAIAAGGGGSLQFAIRAP